MSELAAEFPARATTARRGATCSCWRARARSAERCRRSSSPRLSLAAYDLLGADKSLATLPITAFVVGTACGTVPAALLMRRIGRRPRLHRRHVHRRTRVRCSTRVAMSAASFLLLCAGAFLVGFSAAFVQQFRFAAADTASDAFRPRAISLVMTGGIVAAIIGPQTVIHTADLLAPIPFAGAYLSAAVLSLAAVLVLAFLDIPRAAGKSAELPSGRPIGEIARRPEFLVAVGCATSAFALMSFVMTAAPLAMVLHHHHRDAADARHPVARARDVPAELRHRLADRALGAERVVAAGLLLLIGCALVALAGTAVGHFWLALVLLGVGWNFGFIGGTALVTETYRPEEKEKVQALNDFLIFGVVALASFSSGEMLLSGGWNVLNIVVLPVAFVCLAGAVLADCAGSHRAGVAVRGSLDGD